MPGRGRAIGQVAVLLGWAVAVATLFLTRVYPAAGPWASAALQVAAYAVIVAPALVVRPRVLPVGATPRTVGAAVVVLLLAVLFAGLVLRESTGAGLRHAVRAVSAGVGEEVVFRGAIHHRLGAVTRRPVVRASLDAALFTLFHVPLVVLQGAPLHLVLVLVLGLVFSCLRTWSRGLLLPAAVHVAVDLSG